MCYMEPKRRHEGKWRKVSWTQINKKEVLRRAILFRDNKVKKKLVETLGGAKII